MFSRIYWSAVDTGISLSDLRCLGNIQIISQKNSALINIGLQCVCWLTRWSEDIINVISPEYKCIPSQRKNPRWFEVGVAKIEHSQVEVISHLKVNQLKHSVFEKYCVFVGSCPQLQKVRSSRSWPRITSDFFLWLTIHLYSGEITFGRLSNHLVEQKTHWSPILVKADFFLWNYLKIWYIFGNT